MAIFTKSSFLLVAALVTVAAPAAAQADEPKVRLSLGGGTTAGAIDGDFAAGLSMGYRFSKMFSFDVEVLAIDGAADGHSVRPLNIGGVTTSSVTARVGDIFASVRRGFPGLPTFPGFPGDVRVNTDGDTLLSTVGFRFLIPTTDARFRPYVSGGLGVARTEESFDIRVLGTDTRNRTTMAPTSVYVDEVSHTGLAGGAGVGASVRVWKGLALGVDARYYRLDRGRNLGTFGGSISYGF